MLYRVKEVSFAVALTAGLCRIASAAAPLPPGVTSDEVKCESGTGKALSKFVGSKSSCAQKCLAAARKTSGPYTDCFAPYGGATATCILDPAKGAEAKAKAAIVKACTTDCPECYAASNCSTGNPFVSTTESLLDLQGPSVYCTENGAGTPSKTEAKCEDSTGKSLGKFVAAKSKCYDKCNQSMVKAKIPTGSCNPPIPSDAATATCITTAESKTAAAIDKACSTAGANPACYDGSLLRPNTGAGWVALVESIVDGQVPQIACGSPSGAFLE